MWFDIVSEGAALRFSHLFRCVVAWTMIVSWQIGREYLGRHRVQMEKARHMKIEAVEKPSENCPLVAVSRLVCICSCFWNELLYSWSFPVCVCVVPNSLNEAGGLWSSLSNRRMPFYPARKMMAFRLMFFDLAPWKCILHILIIQSPNNFVMHLFHTVQHQEAKWLSSVETTEETNTGKTS